MAEHLKVGVAIADEPIHIVVVPFEQLGGLHEDGFDPKEGWFVIGVPASYGFLPRRR